jgi:hypothetical protein
LYGAIAEAQAGAATLSEDAFAELDWWLERLAVDDGHPIVRPDASMVLYTDASDDGWGAWCGDSELCGALPGPIRQASSTARELYAVAQAIAGFSGRFAGQAVLVRIDNAAAAQILDSASSHSEHCAALARDIFATVEAIHCHLSVEWIPRELNDRADGLSRVASSHDWLITDPALQWACDHFGLDPALLVVRFDRNMPRPDMALSYAWDASPSLVNPPFHLIGDAIAHMQTVKACGLVVLPGWYSQPWWPGVAASGAELLELPEGALVRFVAHSMSVTEADDLDLPFPVFASWLDFRPSDDDMDLSS